MLRMLAKRKALRLKMRPHFSSCCMLLGYATKTLMQASYC